MENSVRKTGFTLLFLYISSIQHNNAVDITLMSKLQAPLKAELDISPLTEQIKALIEQEVERRMATFVDEGLDRIHKAVKSAKLAFQREINDTINSLLTQKTDPTPAFTATLSPHRYIALAPEEIVKFDKVYLNRGGGYDPTTGYYKIPKSGVYMVSCTVRPPGTRNLHVWLWKDDEKLVLAYGSGWQTGSFTVVLHLQKGNKLYIKHPNVLNEKIDAHNTSMFAVVYLSD